MTTTNNGPHFLNWQVHDAELRFASAPPDMKLARARKLVLAKFDRGDYGDVLQALDDDTSEALARALCRAVSAPSSQAPGAAEVPPHTSG